MPNEEGKTEEVLANEHQMADITDVISDFVPVTQAASEESGDIKPEGDGANAEEGKERSEEAAAGQIEDGTGKPKEEGEVKVGADGKPLGEKPAVEAGGEKPAGDAQAQAQAAAASETTEQRLTRENAELRALIEQTVGQVMGPREPQKLTPEQEAEQRKRIEDAAKQSIQFIKDDAMYDLATKDAASFNALLTAVVNTAVAKSVQMLPNVTSRFIDRQMSTRLAVQDFFAANKDLLPHRKYVGFVSNELAAKHPDWDLPTLLTESEKEVRGRLKIARPTQQMVAEGVVQGATRTVESDPAFVPGAGGGGSRRGGGQTDKLTGQDKQIMDLIS